MSPDPLTTPEESRWQRRLLPLMSGILVGLTIFFFLATFVHFFYLSMRIADAPSVKEMDQALSALNEKGEDLNSRLLKSTWMTLSRLEENSIARRYHQANVLLMSRIWTRYLGFVTGMILSLVGAAFILGKMRESPTRLDAEGSMGKFAITSASPGLILAVLGTILMVTTIFFHQPIEVSEMPLYTSTWQPQLTPIGTAKAPPPETPPAEPPEPSVDSANVDPTSEGENLLEQMQRTLKKTSKPPSGNP